MVYSMKEQRKRNERAKSRPQRKKRYGGISFREGSVSKGKTRKRGGPKPTLTQVKKRKEIASEYRFQKKRSKGLI